MLKNNIHHSQPKFFFQNRNSELKQQHTVIGRENNLNFFFEKDLWY